MRTTGHYLPRFGPVDLRFSWPSKYFFIDCDFNLDNAKNENIKRKKQKRKATRNLISRADYLLSTSNFRQATE
jgi:hypothetical protein